ncbi:HXXEE domain-containing protein [Paenibacillus validus]|uniref:HXXEE domain-containing protein n=1 Tax=Paenibacillus validus TaxID=44253 RepID=A0A7X2Z8F4_9BACL|nr:HXXEE domain-containing protein [Paenibacillus validus]MUG70259.1 HXXEE domain-containing protein [Paenibacillus validus]
MVEFLDSFISINSVIWLFLVAFMLHDFEEIIRIEPWFRRHQPSIYRKVPRRFRNTLDSFSRMTAPQFSVAVCLEFVVFVPCTFMAAEHGSYLLFLGFNAVMLLHVFMHIGQAVFVRMLVPGVVTSVLIILPYTIYVFYRLLSEKLITLTDIGLSLPLGLLLIPILLLGHKAGEKLVPNS